MKKNNRKGFTIIELVIVIAVIGILAAVLIPTFSNVISDAKESAALQNARNKYTEYLIAHPGSEYNYVTDGTYTFDINDDFKKVSTQTGQDGVLTIDTCTQPVGSDTSKPCEACGWARG